MPTTKAQKLKNLAKARAALAKKRASGAVKKKVPAKKAPTPRRTKTSGDYVLTMSKNRRQWYYTGTKWDTDGDRARTYSNRWLADAAAQVFTAFGHKVAVKKK